VEVEPLGDVVIGELLHHPPGVDLRYHGTALGVTDQAALDLAQSSLGGHWVFLDHYSVAVRWLADVETLFGVLHQPAPGLLQHVEHIPLGDGLLDPPSQDRCSTLADGSTGSAG